MINLLDIKAHYEDVIDRLTKENEELKNKIEKLESICKVCRE